MPLRPDFEYAALVLSTAMRTLDGQPLRAATCSTTWARDAPKRPSQSHGGARLLLIGGPPFPETILMWWNFVARTPEEIVKARTDWETGLRFGPVKGYDGASIPAPPLARFAQPNPVS